MATSPCAHRLHAVVFFPSSSSREFFSLLVSLRHLRGMVRADRRLLLASDVSLFFRLLRVWCVSWSLAKSSTPSSGAALFFCGSFCAASQYRDRRQSSGIFSTRWMIGVGDGIEECWKRRCNYERWMMVSRTCCRKVELTRADLIAKPGSKVRNSYD